ncbi:MAG: EAL domain-containing protein [Gammaproteobacteria bacterium]|nr:EAL domain-containing protein [Gammaproteobacteria bacterium]
MDDEVYAADDLLAAGFDAVTDAVLLLDGHGRVQRLNRAASALLGISSAQAASCPWSDIVTFDPALSEAPPSADEAGNPRPGEYAVALSGAVSEPGLRVTLLVWPLDAPARGSIMGLRPQRDLSRLEADLAHSRHLLRLACIRGQVGLWEWDVTTDLVRESGYWVGRTLHTAAGHENPSTALVPYLHPHDRRQARDALVAYLKGDTEFFECEMRLRALDGNYLHFLVRGQALGRDLDGRVLSMAGTNVDLSAYREQEALLEFALESSQQGIWDWDLDRHRITEHNYWRPDMARYRVPSVLSQARFMDLLPADDRERLRECAITYLRGGTTSMECEVRIARQDGTWGELLLRGRALERDDDGRVHRIIGTYTEIGALKAQERRLQLALENGRQGLFEWWPENDRLDFSREWYAMFGYPPGAIASLRVDLQRILHHDDVASGFAALVPMLRGERDTFEVEHRLRHADGHYLTVLSRGRVIERDAAGRAVRVIGTHVDVSALKATETRLLESRKLLETVIDAFPQRVFWKSLDDHYLGANRRFARDAGFDSPERLIGKAVADVPWPIAFDEIAADDRRLLDSGESHITVRRPFRTVAGEEFWAETTKVPILDAGGETIGILAYYDDVTEEQAREVQLRTVAEALTGHDRARLLDNLARAAAELAGADFAFIGRCQDDRATLDIIARFPADGVQLESDYGIAGTPCARSLEDGFYFLRDGARERFPDAGVLHELDIAGYAGRQLTAADGHALGLLVLLFKQANADAGRVRRVIDVLEARITSELERELSLAELAASEQRLNAAIEAGGQGVWEWTPRSDALNVIGPFFRDRDVRTGHDIEALHHPDDLPQMRRVLREFLTGRTTFYEYEARLRVSADSYCWMLVRARAAERDAAQRVTRLIGTVTDISALKTAQATSEQAQQFLGLVIDTVPQAIFWQDLEFRYGGCNQRFADLAGVADPQDLVGRTDDDLWWAEHARQFHEADRRLLDGEVRQQRFENEIRRPGREPGWYETTKVAMRDADGHIIGILGAIHDITTRKRAEDAARHLARFDPLTNLPNRRYFAERLETSLAAAARHLRMGALLFIDLDQFKQINDTLGHSVGDSLLQAVAERLRNVTRQEDTVARLGGDEFVVLLPEVAADLEACARQAQTVAEKIHSSLGQPFQFDHHQFHITPTIGISLFPEGNKSVDDVLKEADTAMYNGKAAGRNVTRFFRREMEEAAQARLRIEGDLRRAIVRREFELAFQPQVDRVGEVTGAEVLLRWRHPERGMIPPGEFIPIAEERGLIVDIGRWVLDAAFDSFRRWTDDGSIDLDELAINVSSRQFRSDDFVADVERLLVLHRIPPHRIVFEITESTVVEDVEATIEIMERLRRVGIRFAIDDFGIGYSSLSYLKRLPIDQLKIDRSFIADIGRDNNDEVICQTIVAMSQHLRLQTIAEGVETREQYNFLSRLRCNGYQGYLFLRPSSEQEFLDYCRHTQAMA